MALYPYRWDDQGRIVRHLEIVENSIRVPPVVTEKSENSMVTIVTGCHLVSFEINPAGQIVTFPTDIDVLLDSRTVFSLVHL